MPRLATAWPSPARVKQRLRTSARAPAAVAAMNLPFQARPGVPAGAGGQGMARRRQTSPGAARFRPVAGPRQRFCRKTRLQCPPSRVTQWLARASPGSKTLPQAPRAPEAARWAGRRRAARPEEGTPLTADHPCEKRASTRQSLQDELDGVSFPSFSWLSSVWARPAPSKLKQIPRQIYANLLTSHVISSPISLPVWASGSAQSSQSSSLA